ncbi:AAA family ATPase, partial [Candidatus Sumerlaeota bacterium]|nr:AAA family ATPase [Candidatus Sumerlaeota bacterium]
MAGPPQLITIQIHGYRPFKDFKAEFGPIEVIVGANASGKSSLFEFLRFLRDGMNAEIPPEIVTGWIGQQIFHVPGPERFSWCAETESERFAVVYQGEVMGPVGRPRVVRERLLRRPDAEELVAGETGQSPHNWLALARAYPSAEASCELRECIRAWRFYSAFSIADDKIRRPAVIEENPVLAEDCGNLAAVLFHLMTEHKEAFDELQVHLRLAIPGFRGLSVKAGGGRGLVTGFWQEDGVDGELALADLSDGVLRFLCWAVLCIDPDPPPLICIDEPDLGVHPRTLPILAGLFKKASQRTQFLLASHASYFLTQFDISEIAVMRKENGEAKFIKPKDSKALMAVLEEFG